MTEHTCHARECNVVVDPKLFMCRKHWLMLPSLYRRAILRSYRPGQEVDKRPSTIYLQMAKDAIKVVWDIEQSLKAKAVPLFDNDELGAHDGVPGRGGW